MGVDVDVDTNGDA